MAVILHPRKSILCILRKFRINLEESLSLCKEQILGNFLNKVR